MLEISNLFTGVMLSDIQHKNQDIDQLSNDNRGGIVIIYI